MSRAMLLEKCIVVGRETMEHAGTGSKPRKVGRKQMVSEGLCLAIFGHCSDICREQLWNFKEERL